MLPTNEGEEVPFVGTTVGPICGYKVLMLNTEEEPRLLSPHKSFEWWPERTHEFAKCNPATSGPLEHEVPSDSHTCGFYMNYKLSHARWTVNYLKIPKVNVHHFVALVAAWGRVIHHRTGCRSSEMEIIGLHDGAYKFKDELKSLARGMDLPFLPTEELEELAAKNGVVIGEK